MPPLVKLIEDGEKEFKKLDPDYYVDFMQVFENKGWKDFSLDYLVSNEDYVRAWRDYTMGHSEAFCNGSLFTEAPRTCVSLFPFASNQQIISQSITSVACVLFVTIG